MKKTFLALLSLLLVTAHLEGALVASYRFTGGTLEDSSGNGNNATVVGAAMNGAVMDESRGEVFDLSGGSGTEGNPGTYLDLPVGGAGTSSWSLALWIKDGPAENSYLFDNRDFVGAAGGDARLIFSTEHNTPDSGVGLFTGAWTNNPTTVRDDLWHHVAWVYDSPTTTLTIYVDGMPSETNTTASDLLTASVRLGNRSGDGAAGQTGRLIDNVSIFDNAISQENVTTLINDSTPPQLDTKLKLTNIGRDHDAQTVDLTWASVDGSSEYEVLGSTDLALPYINWTREAINVPATGDSTSIQLTDITADTKFFVVGPQSVIPPQPPVAGLVMTPWPKSVTETPDSRATFDGTSRIYYAERSTARAIENSLQPLADVLAGEFQILTGFKPLVTPLAGATPGAKDIVLDFAALTDPFAETEDLENQSYSLTVSETAGISVSSEYYKGVSYGTSTLLQLLEQEGGNYTFPAVQIEDEPDAAYRSIMIDVARQVHSIGVLKDAIRLARLYKLRYLHLHLTDDQNFTFPFAPITDNITGNFTYTLAELDDLVDYADARGVTLIPELDLPGHSTKVKQSGYLGNITSDNDVAAAANYTKIHDIIDAMLEVFDTSPYFHIGGDESGASEANLVAFLASVNEHLRGTPPGGKRRLLCWEGFRGTPVDELPPTGDDRIIVLAWESSYNAPWSLLNAGYEVINSSWKPTYVLSAFGLFYRDDVTVGKKWSAETLYDWSKDTFMHWQPGLPVFTDSGPNDPDRSDHEWSATYIGLEDQIIGGQMQMWEHPETSVIHAAAPRLPVLAERLWNQALGDTTETYEAFDTRMKNAMARVMPIIQPVAILPGIPAVPNDTDDRVYDSFTPYVGNSLSVTLQNRTKIPGATIRYEIGGTSQTQFRALFWRSIDDPAIAGTDYTAPFTQAGLFGVRAQLFLADGSPVDGSTWNYYANWENRVNVVEYDVSDNVSLPVPDMTSLPNADIIREVQVPTLRGALRGVRQIARLVTATLTVPQSGAHTLEIKSNNGHCTLFLDLNQNGTFEANEELLTDTANGDFWTAAGPVDLVGGESYALRIDHLQRLVQPRMGLIISGPGITSRSDITPLLSLPE